MQIIKVVISRGFLPGYGRTCRRHVLNAFVLVDRGEMHGSSDASSIEKLERQMPDFDVHIDVHKWAAGLVFSKFRWNEKKEAEASFFQ